MVDMSTSLKPSGHTPQELPDLRDAARAIADEGRVGIEAYYQRQKVAELPSVDELEATINSLLVPAWRSIGRFGVLDVIVHQDLRAVAEVEGCLADARAEVGSRGRAALMLRDRWKQEGLPETGALLVAALDTHLAAFYIADGARALLESMLSK